MPSLIDTLIDNAVFVNGKIKKRKKKKIKKKKKINKNSVVIGASIKSIILITNSANYQLSKKKTFLNSNI